MNNNSNKMKGFLLAGFLIFILGTKAQYTGNSVTGKIDSVYSKILKENRRMWVYVPNNDSNRISAHQNYPVVYLLGGESRFNAVVNMIRQLSDINGNMIIPQMIVVGIDNTDRIRDLTPTHAASELYFDSSLLKTSGGGEKFTAFMEKELFPHIDTSYPAAPYRMLVGSSLGGLLAINTLINHTNLFNAYVAIDPYMQWDNQNLLKQAGMVLSQKKFNGKSLFLAVGNTQQKDWDSAAVMKDTSAVTAPVRSVLQLVSIIKNNAANGLNWSYKYYNVKGYNTVPLIGEFDAMRSIFSEYKLPPFQNMIDSTFNVDSAITDHFKRVSQQMGYKVLPSEALIDKLGNAFLLNKMFDKAYFFYKMNIDNYPKSFNTYDNMGDFYFVSGNSQKAIEYYTKALTLEDFPGTRQKLQRLKAGK